MLIIHSGERVRILVFGKMTCLCICVLSCASTKTYFAYLPVAEKFCSYLFYLEIIYLPRVWPQLSLNFLPCFPTFSCSLCFCCASTNSFYRSHSLVADNVLYARLNIVHPNVTGVAENHVN